MASAARPARASVSAFSRSASPDCRSDAVAPAATAVPRTRLLAARSVSTESANRVALAAGTVEGCGWGWVALPPRVGEAVWTGGVVVTLSRPAWPGGAAGASTGLPGASDLFHGPNCHTPTASPATTTPPPTSFQARPPFLSFFSAGRTVPVPVALTVPQVAVITTEPGPTAVTRPVSETVATSTSVDAQVISSPASVPPPVWRWLAVSWTAPPTATVTWRGDSMNPVCCAAVAAAVLKPVLPPAAVLEQIGRAHV